MYTVLLFILQGHSVSEKERLKAHQKQLGHERIIFRDIQVDASDARAV